MGDKLKVDVAGPQKMGMRTCWLSLLFRIEMDPEIIPDARIQTVDELPAMIELWTEPWRRRFPEPGGAIRTVPWSSST